MPLPQTYGKDVRSPEAVGKEPAEAQASDLPHAVSWRAQGQIKAFLSVG